MSESHLKELTMRISNTSFTISAATAVCLLGGCATAARTTTVESGGEVASTSVVTPMDNRTIPAGAQLNTTLDRALGTNISKAGDMFTATVSSGLYASNGALVVPAGAKIEGHVTALDDSDNATEPALIRLDFDHIRFNGQTYPFAASIVSSNAVQTSNQTSTEKTKQIVIGGAVGAALGGILGKGDLDKIVIGGALGAAAGSIVSLGTEVNATLPAGSAMTLRTTQTTTIR
jgi:hypothetical protein